MAESRGSSSSYPYNQNNQAIKRDSSGLAQGSYDPLSTKVHNTIVSAHQQNVGVSGGVQVGQQGSLPYGSATGTGLHGNVYNSNTTGNVPLAHTSVEQGSAFYAPSRDRNSRDSGYYAPAGVTGTQGSGYYANAPSNRPVSYNSTQRNTYGQTVYAQPGRNSYQPTNRSYDQVNCPNWLLGLLALLAITGIILGILFGVGVIGGRNVELNQPTSTWGTQPDSSVYETQPNSPPKGMFEVDQPYTVIIQTIVVNRSAAARATTFPDRQ